MSSERTTTGKLATHTVIRQASTGYFRSVWVDQPMIIFVQQGRKYLATDRHSVYAEKQEAAVLSADLLVNIENRPDSECDYIAEVFIFDNDMIRKFYETHFPGSEHRNNNSIDRLPVSIELHHVFQEAKAALQSATLSERIVEHRVSELLLWLAEQGIYFATSKQPNEVDKVRKLLLSDIANDWKAAGVAQELGVSEPTLRRHLAKENTSFSEILSDLRLGKALEMLQATDLPVTTIAYDLGFGSPSHFTERFKKRFDIPPTAIRKKTA